MRSLFRVPLAACVVACNAPAGSDSTPLSTTTNATAPTALPHVDTPPINVAAIDSLLKKVVADKHLVGVSVGVMQNGKVILANGYGFRRLAPNEPLTATTMMPIGSVTKQFTCTAALLLAQDGKLSMRDPVSKYVPTATRASAITLLDLGQHVSGYRDYYPLDFVDREMQKAESADTIIARYATRALDFEPGSRWSYSNTNFLILGKAIEAAARQPIAAVLSARIFGPLGMTRTAYDPPPGDTGMSRGYTSYALASPSPALPEASGWTGAAGAMWSTPTDLLAWDLSLLENTLLNSASFATLTTPRTLSDGRSTGYGCGMSTQLTGDAVVLSHGGAVAGSVATNIIIPVSRSAIVVLSNADFAATGEIVDALLPKLMPHVDAPTIAGLSAIDAAKAFLASVERGTVDRTTLGDDFNALLTPAHLAADRTALATFGKVTDVQVLRTRERGGMEVALVQFMVGKTPARSAMYRTPDGKIQQLLINRR